MKHLAYFLKKTFKMRDLLLFDGFLDNINKVRYDEELSAIFD